MTSHRRTLAAALATAAASVSFYPIFTGGLWFLAGLGAIAVVAAAGTATRWRRLPEPVCLAAGLVALLLYLNVAFANSRSLLLLVPTPASARLLAHLVDQGFTEAGEVRPAGPRARPDGAAGGGRDRDRGPADRLDGGPAWQRRAGRACRCCCCSPSRSRSASAAASSAPRWRSASVSPGISACSAARARTASASGSPRTRPPATRRTRRRWRRPAGGSASPRSSSP